MTHQMLVRLTKKLALAVDGVDLRHCDEGNVIDLPERDAELLIAERWAVQVVDEQAPTRPHTGHLDARGVAADRASRAPKRGAGSADRNRGQ